MVWQTPKTNWTAQDSVTPSELNRIEGNIAELKKAATIDIQDTAGNFAATNVEDALQELAGNVKNGKTNIANAITAMGQTASGNDTFDTLAAKIRDISKDATAGTGDVLSGKTFYAGGAKKTGTMPNRGAVVITPGTQNQAIPAGYHNGQGYVKGDANLKSTNIVRGVSIFGVAGSVPRGIESSFFFAGYGKDLNLGLTKGTWPSGYGGILEISNYYIEVDGIVASRDHPTLDFAVVTNNPVDLTPVRFILIFPGNAAWSDLTTYFVVSTSKDGDYNTYNRRASLMPNGSPAWIDVSSLTGQYYLRWHVVVPSNYSSSYGWARLAGAYLLL